MKYTVTITAAARHGLRRIDPQYRGRVERAIDALRSNPAPRQSEKMRGYEFTWRLKVGRYRVIYEVYEDRLHVVVIKAGPRSEDTYRI